jgi:excisionase family DNA binding protein
MKAKELSVKQTAQQMKNTAKYVRDLLYEQRLAGAYKKGRVWRIPVSAVEAHLKAREQSS